MKFFRQLWRRRRLTAAAPLWVPDQSCTTWWSSSCGYGTIQADQTARYWIIEKVLHGGRLLLLLTLFCRASSAATAAFQLMTRLKNVSTCCETGSSWEALHLRRGPRRLGFLSWALEFLKLHAGCSIRKLFHTIRLPESAADVVIRTHDQAWSEVDFQSTHCSQEWDRLVETYSSTGHSDDRRRYIYSSV